MSVLSLVLVLIEKIYQTIKTVFDHTSKHIEVRQKYFPARRIFNYPIGVWKCSQTRSLVFHILHTNAMTTTINTDVKQIL